VAYGKEGKLGDQEIVRGGAARTDLGAFELGFHHAQRLPGCEDGLAVLRRGVVSTAREMGGGLTPAPDILRAEVAGGEMELVVLKLVNSSRSLLGPPR
jgi:hypothetical protein